MTSRCASWMSALVAALVLCGDATALDNSAIARLQGPWVPEGSRCDDVFRKQGTSINFMRRGAEMREGILVKGDRIADSRNRCTIARVRSEAERSTLLLSCFSGLLVSQLAFSLRFIDDDTVLRTFSDFPDNEMRWKRCKL